MMKEGTFKVGAITVSRMYNLFAEDENACYTTFERDGWIIGTAVNGKIRRCFEGKQAYDTITRAKAYRYWEKYFPERYAFTLPEPIQVGLEEPCRSFGTFYDKNGELWGYEG